MSQLSSAKGNTRYLLIKFEDEEFWVEVRSDGYASRQIIIDKDRNMHVSCLEDCLFEGSIDESELDGTIKIVSQSKFEKKWNNATLTKRKLWVSQKVRNPIGKRVRSL
ncbi:hypothetical protein ACFQZE_19020 [Paenibacillus sp. GCM10027627]|uniref:hypothetical protein n=1 Tax=unclassified Paenibacillus TaxID=185978 RepID=UPI00362BBA6B